MLGITKTWLKYTAIIIFNTLLILVLIDGVLRAALGKEKYFELLGDLNINYKSYYRVYDPVYDHGLLENITEKTAWGHVKYRICTNNRGFKASCKNQNVGKNYDVGFIGDSFTESVGYDYEDTFVGLYHDKFPNKSIANLGVSSYSPSIYYAKINQLLKEGYRFKHIVVMMDISDIQDEATVYQLVGDRIFPAGHPELLKRFYPIRDYALLSKNWIKQNLMISYHGLKSFRTGLSNAITNKNPPQDALKPIRNFDLGRSQWTYKPNSSAYGEGGVSGGIENATFAMQKLYDLLNEHGIKMSIGVYPWPAQLKYDTRNHRGVTLWQEFCHQKCVHFINANDLFFDYMDEYGFNKTLEEFYIDGDIHFNLKGNAAIADVLNEYDF